MSVVTRIRGPEGKEQLWSYAKGSPEIMTTIMDKQTIPHNYAHVLSDYASNGFRVLAIASKPLLSSDFKSLTRGQVESGLTFNGFEVFENKLKGETVGAIRELKEAQIGVVMITGDNSLTGSNISFKCGISSKEKGMFIIDYREGSFVEEKFEYREWDEDVSTQNPKARPEVN